MFIPGASHTETPISSISLPTACPTSSRSAVSQLCASTVRTYETEEKFTDEVQCENGAGRFYFDGEQNLIWETEGADEGIAFMKVG